MYQKKPELMNMLIYIDEAYIETLSSRVTKSPYVSCKSQHPAVRTTSKMLKYDLIFWAPMYTFYGLHILKISVKIFEAQTPPVVANTFCEYVIKF